MLNFQPFLTLNKSTSQLTYNHLDIQTNNLICVVQTTQSAFEKLIKNLECQVGINRKQEEYGIYISTELFHNHYILYLDGKESKEVEEKYLGFFEKVIIALSGKIVFGDRSDYSRLLANIEDKETELYMFLQTKNEIYKINSIQDNRLQVGYSMPFPKILASAKEKPALSSALLSQVSSFFSHELMRETLHISNLNIVYEWIISGIELRREYQQFKTAMIDKAVSMFKKQELVTLLSHIQSLSPSLNCYEQHLIEQFKSEINLKNESLKQPLLEDIYQRYKTINATSYDQFKMEIAVKFQLIKYSVDQYLPDPVHYANSILHRISSDFCQPLFTSLKTQLQEETETKECLTNEVDQQIRICENLKREIERLNRRIDQMSNIDEVLRDKEGIIRDLQAKNDKLRSSQILLEGENIKKENLIRHLESKLEEKSEIEKSLFDQVSKKTTELTNLSKIFKQIHKEKEDLAVSLKKKTDQTNQIRKIFHSAHEAKSVFEKKCLSQEKCLNQIQNRLHDIKDSEKVKANMVINLNLAQHKQIQAKNVKLEQKIDGQQKKMVSLTDQNRKLRIQINYFQKMFSHTKEKITSQHPLIIIEENEASSTDRKIPPNEGRVPFEEVDNVMEDGEEWVNSSRKQCEKSIGSLHKMEIQEGKYTYF